MKTLLVTGGCAKKGRHRVNKQWSLDNFDDGYIDNRGRFRVYFPNHPRAYEEGYILRSIVAYEAYHGVSVTKEYAIHHKNGNRLDDSKENLEQLLFGAHSRKHNECKKNGKNMICATCGKTFYVTQWRLNQKWHVGKYCGLDCYFKRGSKK
jgi:hypothetical protein